MNQKTSPPKPAVPYTSVLGQVLQHYRNYRQLHQQHLANALNISQSAYSRIEQGSTSVSVPQLRIIAQQLGMTPDHILRETDKYAEHLKRQGVEVTDDKGISPAAIVIGLGILAALLMAKK